MKKVLLFSSIMHSIFFISQNTIAGGLDTSFNVSVNSGSVDYAKLSDGSIVVAGQYFTTYGTAGSTSSSGTSNRILILNADGTTKQAFSVGASGVINNVELFPNDDILIAGEFVTFDGVTVNRIAKLIVDTNDNDNDGNATEYVLDTTFNAGGSGFNGAVLDIDIQSDGKILAAGAFTSYNANTVYKYLIRLNSDGSIDTGFNSGTATSANINTVKQLSDDKIMIGGITSAKFNDVAITSSSLLRLNADGSLDSTFPTGITTKTIQKIKEYSGKYYIGGASGYIARLNTNGLADETFQLSKAINYYSSYTYRDFAFLDNRILIAGNLANGFLNGGTGTYGISYSKHIISVDYNGVLDPSFNLNGGAPVDTTLRGPGSQVYKILLLNSKKALLGGAFTNYTSNTNLSGTTYTTYNNYARLAQIYLETHDATLSNDNLSKNNIKLFPNPVTDILNYTSDKDIAEISIFNFAGQKNQVQKVNAKEGKLLLSNLPTGNYLVKVKFKNGEEKTVKIIKK